VHRFGEIPNYLALWLFYENSLIEHKTRFRILRKRKKMHEKAKKVYKTHKWKCTKDTDKNSEHYYYWFVVLSSTLWEDHNLETRPDSLL